MKLLLIGIFGVIGIYSRYFLDIFFSDKNFSFPLATLVANIVGSMLVVLFYCVLQSKEQTALQQSLIIGFCGGLTTFSSYTFQSFQMIEQGQFLKASTYFFGSPVIGLITIFFTFFFLQKIY